MEKYESKVAQNALEIVREINFGDNRIVRPVTKKEVADDLKRAGLGLDYRASIEEKSGQETVFKGLAFDNNSVRTQCFAIYENEQPIAVMSIVIAPKNWIEKQRYVKLDVEKETITILDYKGVANVSDLPDFIIVPAWSKVVDSHKTKLAMPGFRAMKNIFDMLERVAPPNTFMEAIAQGRLPNEKKEMVEKLFSEKQVGTNIEVTELPFPTDLIGQNTDGSSSTVKMAKLFGLQKIENVGCGTTLGPVFIKRIK